MVFRRARSGRTPSATLQWLWILAIVVGFVVVVFSSLRPSTPPADPSPRQSASGFPIARRETCKRMAQEYREAWHDAARCSSDQECKTEARGGEWFGLDGCFRIGGTAVDHSAADALAQSWLTAGCAQDYEICPPAPRGQCKQWHCIELPPERVPSDWKRVDMARALTFYIPAEFVRQPAFAEDSVHRLFAMPGATFYADYGDNAHPLDYEPKPTLESNNPEWALVEEKALLVAGHKARRVVARSRYEPWCSDASEPCRAHWRFEVGIHFPEVPLPGRPGLYFGGRALGPVRPKLTLAMNCDVLADCAQLDRIVESLTFW